MFSNLKKERGFILFKFFKNRSTAICYALLLSLIFLNVVGPLGVPLGILLGVCLGQFNDRKKDNALDN